LKVLFGFTFGHPGKKLLFMGAEFGQKSEWNHDKGLDWHQLEQAPYQGIQAYVHDLNHLYVSEPALYADQLREQGFSWIDYHDFHNSMIVFLRKTQEADPQPLIFVCNFLPTAHTEYRIGVPQPGHYHEVLNSDHSIYGGSNLGNPEGCEAEPVSWQRQPYSIVLTLPPLSVLVLKSGAVDKSQQKSAKTLHVKSRKSSPAEPGASSKISQQQQVPPFLPVPLIPHWLPEEERPRSSKAAILQRGQRIPETPEHLEESTYSDQHTSGAGQPQGSKRAILAESGVIDDKKRSSG
jgi:hypothetical protein